MTKSKRLSATSLKTPGRGWIGFCTGIVVPYPSLCPNTRKTWN